MLTRTADDVWTEISDRCRRLLKTGTPVPTLRREVQNWITAVGDTKIRRRSESPKGNDQDSPVQFSEISAIWRELTQNGETTDPHVLSFTYALVGRLIDGIRFEPQPFRLVVVNEQAADRSWISQRLEQAELAQARERLLKAIQDLRVYREGEVRAPHKPLLLLLVLASYAKGTARRTVTFADIEPPLRRLIAQFSNLSPEVEPQEPFWRLKSSGVWQLAADGELDLQSSSPPGLRSLREHKVRGGFDTLTDRALWSDATLGEDAVDRLLDGYFPTAVHPDLRKAVGLPTTGGEIGGKAHPSEVDQYTRFFIFNTGAEHSQQQYDDILGERLGFDADVAGRKPLLAAGSGRFIYYRTSKGSPTHPSSFIGTGKIASVAPIPPSSDGKARWEATLIDYQPFRSPVRRAVYSPPGWNHQHGIAEISRDVYDKIVALGGLGSSRAIKFGAASLEEAAVARGLRLDSAVYWALAAAVESGKHVILTGPPGTAKTTLAEVTADLARQAGRCDGFKLTTATADWTTYETIGGLTPANDRAGLVFRPGHFLESAANNKWLVIDELNRSNFDRAFGQFFTILSGQSVALPYEDAESGRPIAVVVNDDPNYQQGEYSLIRIPKQWRIIATMNVFDKSLLFEMSFALMRRFAFVEVPAPDDADYKALWAPYLEDLAPDLADRVDTILLELLTLRTIKEVGPAVFIDMARFARAAVDTAVDSGALAYQLFYSYLLAQFEGIDRKTGDKLFSAVSALVGTSLRARLRSTLNDVLGLTLAAPGTTPVEDNDLPVEPDLLSQS